MKALHLKQIFLCCLLTSVFLVSTQASAWIHIARQGETLSQLAIRYYGSERYAMILRAANGFIHPDDGSLISGEQILVPEITYHKAKAGESWNTLADRYLGSKLRASFLAELNNTEEQTALSPGQIVKIPYQLLYILAPNETLKDIVKNYIGDKYSTDWLKAYNQKQGKKFDRGDPLLLPLMDVEILKKEKERIKALSEEADKLSKEDQKLQLAAIEQIADLRKAFDQGHYLRIVALGQRLLGMQHLSEPQKIGVYKYLGFAYVAFNENQLAIEAFQQALILQPGMVLSPITTSPKIVDVFDQARKSLKKNK